MNLDAQVLIDVLTAKIHELTAENVQLRALLEMKARENEETNDDEVPGVDDNLVTP